MKLSGWLLAGIMVGTLALVGCNKPTTTTTTSVDTSALQTSFQSAEATVKESADKAIAAVKNSDYAGAVAELKKLAENAKLTPEQQQAVKDVLAKVQSALSETAGKAAEQVDKAAAEAGKALKDVPKTPAP